MTKYDQLKKVYSNFLVPLDEVRNYIEWYNRAVPEVSAWDEERFKFCNMVIHLDVLHELGL
jgi:hypothetical protein